MTTTEAPPHPGITSTEVDVTPELATQWLQLLDDRTRKLRDTDVTKFASDMTNRRWICNGEAIKFCVDGTMIDGRHRLTAVIKSGRTIRMVVQHGLPVEAKQALDLGTPRTIADQLSIAGYTHAPVLASGGKLALAWLTDRLRDRTATISATEVQEFITGNQRLLEAAGFASITRCLVAPSVVCAVTWRAVIEGHDPERVHGFFQALADLQSGGYGDPKHALLHRIQEARAARERFKQTTLLSMVVRAFNADVEGKTLRRMVAVYNGSPMEVPPLVEPGTPG